MSTAKKKAPKPKKKAAKGNWSEVMKKALESKRPGGGWPDQPKPRDSGKPKMRKNAF
jgi:hypothetical protein